MQLWYLKHKLRLMLIVIMAMMMLLIRQVCNPLYGLFKLQMKLTLSRILVNVQVILILKVLMYLHCLKLVSLIKPVKYIIKQIIIKLKEFII